MGSKQGLVSLRNEDHRKIEDFLKDYQVHNHMSSHAHRNEQYNACFELSFVDILDIDAAIIF